MSKNISKLSGRIGLRDNLFDEISRSSLNSDNGKGIKDIKEIQDINKMLSLYGFNKMYIKNYKKYCIKSVKRTLNYKRISTSISKKFINDFYNLLFN